MYGAPDRIRTCDPRLRRAVLYPAELRALKSFYRLSILSHVPVAWFRPGHPWPVVTPLRHATGMSVGSTQLSYGR